MPKFPDHPLASEPPFVDKPGGGPREDFGADQSSDVTAVVAFKSIRPPFEVGNFPGGLIKKISVIKMFVPFIFNSKIYYNSKG